MEGQWARRRGGWITEAQEARARELAEAGGEAGALLRLLLAEVDERRRTAATGGPCPPDTSVGWVSGPSSGPSPEETIPLVARPRSGRRN